MADQLRRNRFVLAGALASTMLFTGMASLAHAKETTPLIEADSFAGAFLAGGAALGDNNFEAAAFYYDQALKFDPNNVDLQRELMVSLINDGRFDEALPYAANLKDELEIERVSRLALAIDAMRNGNFDDTEVLLILTRPNDIERLLTGIMQGWSHLGKGNADLALETIDELNGPDWFDLFKAYHTALIADAAGKTDEARQRYDEAMNNSTGGSASPLTYLRLSEAYAGHLIRAGENSAAAEIIERGLGIAPNNPVLLDLKENLAATTDVRFIKEPSHGAAEILLNLGSAINREGAETFASLYLQMAEAAKANEPQTLFELGTIADRLDLTEKAIAYYKAVPEASPLHRPAALQQGLALSSVDRNDEAIETLKKLAAENPSDYSGHMALGGVLAVERRFEEVIDVYKEALEYIDNDDPRFWPLHYRLAIAYERTKQWPLAEATFKKALELSPNQPDVLNYLGYSWIDMNINLDEGMEMIEKAVEMRPRDGYIVDSLGWAQYRLGQFDEAVETLERATELRPRDPTINDHLGDAYWRVGRKLEASFQWSQVLDMEGEDVDKDKVRAKLDAANSGASPEIASSIADDKDRAQLATNDEQQIAVIVPELNTNTSLINQGPKIGTDEPATTTQEESAVEAQPRIYVVKDGDSLWTIAKDIPGGVPALLELNRDRITNPNVILPGTELRLPET